MAFILIVDDDPLVRETLGAMLESDGHEIAAASDGAQALAMANAKIPELLITDIFMPKSDGVETIRAFNRLHPHVPIIAISGGGSNTDGQLFLKMASHFGATHTLGKPVKRTVLLETVSACLPARGIDLPKTISDS